MFVLRNSSLPYAGSLILTILLASYANYVLALLYPPNITFKGQVPAIVIPFIGFPITFVLWLLYKGKPSTSKMLQIFFLGLMTAWVLHFVIMKIHDDMYVHIIWLYVPTILFLALKTPSADEAWSLIRLLAWTAATIMVLTRALEIVGFLPQWYIPDPELAQWERERYWLPLADLWGLASRWPGPFGYNSKTGFVAVFLVVVALAKWRRSNVALVLVGVLGMLVTGGRGVYLSALAGILILLVFSRKWWFARLSSWGRFALLVIPTIALGLRFFFSSTSSTGRAGEGGIWESFLSLWQTNFWLGVGQTGISASSGQVEISMDAHSIYIQELTKFGIIGFLAQFAMLAVAIAICLKAALRGRPEGLAIVSIYVIFGVTEVLNDGWQDQSMYTIMIILAAVASTIQSRDHVRGSSNPLSAKAKLSQSE